MLGGIIPGLTKLHVHVCGAEGTHRGETAERAPAPRGLVSVLGQGHFQPSHSGQPPALQVSPQCWPELLRLFQT